MKMDPRNKRALLILASAGAVFAFIMLVMGGGGGSAESDLRRARKLRDDFNKSLAEYRTISAQVDAIDHKIATTPADFDLFGALGKIEEDLGIQGNIKNKTKNTAGGTDFYSESYITMDLQKITLDQLVKLLGRIEDITAGGQAFVRVSQLTVKRSFRPEERSLDVTIKVTLYSKPGESSP
jgi:hypothetical protein